LVWLNAALQVLSSCQTTRFDLAKIVLCFARRVIYFEEIQLTQRNHQISSKHKYRNYPHQKLVAVASTEINTGNKQQTKQTWNHKLKIQCNRPHRTQSRGSRAAMAVAGCACVERFIF